jgi:hypothetical protein
MAEQDRIEQIRALAEANFLKGTPVAQLAELIADELEQQRLRVETVEGRFFNPLTGRLDRRLDRPRDPRLEVR